MVVPRRDSGRANVSIETVPRTAVRESWSRAARATYPTPAPGVPGLCRLYAQHVRVVGISSLPESECDGGEFAGERHARHFLSHAALEHAEVEILERPRTTDGCGGRSLEDVLENPVVIPVEAAGERLAMTPHRLTRVESPVTFRYVRVSPRSVRRLLRP